MSPTSLERINWGVDLKITVIGMSLCKHTWYKHDYTCKNKTTLADGNNLYHSFIVWWISVYGNTLIFLNADICMYLLQLIGLAVVILAIWMLTDPTFYVSMAQDENNYYISLYIFLAAGALLLFVAFLGCCGAFKESKCMLISVNNKYYSYSSQIFQLKIHE